MTTKLLAQALATASNPYSSVEELGEVIGDLIRFGAFDAADSVLERLRESGREPHLVERLQRLNHRARDVGPDFEHRFLAKAIRCVNSPESTDDQLLQAAESLIVWGALDEADCAIERLKPSHGYLGRVNRLSAASHQLRRSGILEELRTLTREQSLSKPYEVLIKRRDGADRTLVVFAGAERKFWLSLNVLHAYLRRFNAHVIYLSDHSGRMYLNGLGSVGEGYEPLLSCLRSQIDDLGASQVHIMAISAGGFVGLRAAKDLRAASYAGFSIRTTLDVKEEIVTGFYLERMIEDCRFPEMLVNLRQELADSEYPRRIMLYSGDLNSIDRAHVENLAGIERVEVNLLTNFKPHNCVTGMVARGQFVPMLKRLLTDPREVTVAANRVA